MIIIFRNQKKITDKFFWLWSRLTLKNMDEFEKQVQTLQSVHPPISKYRQAVKKKLGCVSYFQPACLYREIRGRTLKAVFEWCVFLRRFTYVCSNTRQWTSLRVLSTPYVYIGRKSAALEINTYSYLNYCIVIQSMVLKLS